MEEKINLKVEEKRKYILSISSYSMDQIEGIDRVARVIKKGPIELVELAIGQWLKTIRDLDIETEVMDLFVTKYDMYDVNKLFKEGK